MSQSKTKQELEGQDKFSLGFCSFTGLSGIQVNDNCQSLLIGKPFIVLYIDLQLKSYLIEYSG